MSGYNDMTNFKGTFKNSTSLPFIGMIFNDEIAGSSQSALNNSDTQLLPGDPVVLLIQNNDSAKKQLQENGVNYNNLIISKKASTTTGGANSTDVCGFMGISSSDVALGNGALPVSQKGQLAKVAPLSLGASMWLEVAQNNTSDFQGTLDINVAITLDTTNGGIKKGSGTDVIVGAKVVSGLQKCQKMVLRDGVYSVEECYGVMVRFL